MRILLVEDDAMSRELWTLLLETACYRVTAAESGARALESLTADTRHDVVLMDMQMPGLSGAALAEALRRACGESRLIVLAMSGSQPRNLGAGDALEGFDGFLLKPFTVEALAAKIAAGLAVKIVHGSEKPTGAATPPTGIDSAAGVEILDLAVHARLAAAMPTAKLDELYALCLRDARSRIEKIAAAGSDADMICAEAHAIKGGCGMIGANEVARLAAALEADRRHAGTAAVTGTLATLRDACDRLEGMLMRHTKRR